MGEALLREKLAQRGYSAQWQVASAGVLALPGIPASEFSVLEMADRGLDISNHRSQIVTPQLMKNSQLIFVMTHHHQDALNFQYPEHKHKVKLFAELRGIKFDIDDPFGEPRDGYAECARNLSGLVEIGEKRLLNWLVEVQEQGKI
jgi:protein-tyrosine phosphatase